MTPQRVFLTGEPGCGKTTAVEKTIRLLNDKKIKVGGFISHETREIGVRIGFSIKDLLTNRTGTLANTKQRTGPRLGRYYVNLQDITDIGVSAIEQAILEADLIVVDELGPMELKSIDFTKAVRKALTTPKPFLGTLHKHATHELVNEVRSKPEFQIIEVNLQNRETLPHELLRMLAN
ncbi:MAG TPA: NTPase [Terriglobales bacterium]|nr:NTPase [Terriglobales bacterium]